jgi:hypothetical protein
MRKPLSEMTLQELWEMFPIQLTEQKTDFVRKVTQLAIEQYGRGKYLMSDWFTIDRIDADTTIISEYRHWEETHSYLLNGNKRSLLVDTGLGICDISTDWAVWL